MNYRRRTYIRFIPVLVAVCFIIVMLAGAGAPTQAVHRAPASPYAQLEQELEDLRVDLKIPGMSAAIARDGEIVWAQGFGWADLENKIPADTQSIYHIASLTKPYAATVILQLVEEGKLQLNEPVSDYGIYPDRNDNVQVWHLLSHTSADKAGSKFKYDGRAFGELEQIVKGVTNRSFATEITERIIKPLRLKATAPNPLDTLSFVASGLDRTRIEQRQVSEYAKAWGRLLWPSGLLGPNKLIERPTYFGTSAGLVASAPDVARFAIALEQGVLLSDSSRSLALTPVKCLSGDSLPYGLGWFLQDYKGIQLVWHYGHWYGSSALIILVPEQKLTFVALANSDGLSRRTKIGDKADLLLSPIAPFFLQKFVQP